jgi:hypothetical protein
MGLESIGGIALPEDLASFLDHIVWQIPTGTISMHAHLCNESV